MNSFCDMAVIPASNGERSIFERALDALPDGVLLVNSQRHVVYANAVFARLWQIPAAVMASRNEGDLLQFAMSQLADPEEFRREVERLHPTTEVTEDEISLRDGRTFARRSLPFEENGTFSARIWIFTDVTEAKRASLDHLTGLMNRRAYSRQFPRFVRQKADGLTRSVAMMDVDNFKRYNDTYGHARGDDVLRSIGAMLASCVKPTGDLLFRIGGEEFLMAARTRDSEEAALLFETIRQRILTMAIEHEGNDPYGFVTVSIGYTCFDTASDPATIFARSDEALYRAKKAGRNRVCHAAP